MPSATRQATPGPGPSTTAKSTTKNLKRNHTAVSSASTAQMQGAEASKENAPDGRETKKMRMDPNAASMANGRNNPRSTSVASSTAETGQQNGERKTKNKRRRKKRKAPVVAQGSGTSIAEMAVPPASNQRPINQSQASQTLPTTNTTDEQSRVKTQAKTKKKAKGEPAKADGDVTMEPSNDCQEHNDVEGDDNGEHNNDKPAPGENKRAEEDEEDDTPRISSSEKGKGKARMDTPSVEESNIPTTATAGTALDTASELAKLREELAMQTSLVDRHQNHLNQSQQSLTCQICLDLLHRPYALSPCGHVTCYPCLVRWFTAHRNPNPNDAGPSNETGNEHNVDHLLDAPAARRGAFIKRNKTCPLCRTVVSERPVEMWTIKSMVASLVRSGLGDLPVPPPTQTDAGPSDQPLNPGGRPRDTDPWRNIFRSARSGTGAGYAAPNLIDIINGLGHQVNGRGAGFNLQQIFGRNDGVAANGNGNAVGNAQNDAHANSPARVGMFDQEDNVYRCIRCLHEIWDGVCTGCHRLYPGHRNVGQREIQATSRGPRRFLATSYAIRNPPMRINADRTPVINVDDSDDSEGLDPDELAMDDDASDEDARNRRIQDQSDMLLRALADGIDIDSDEEDDMYGYDALERAFAGEPSDDMSEDEEAGHFEDFPFPQWHDDDLDDDMSEYDDDNSQIAETDVAAYRQASEEARDFGERMGLLHRRPYGMDDRSDIEYSEDDDSQYGGSFIDDGHDDEENHGSDTDLEEVSAASRHRLHRAPARARRNVIAEESESNSDSDEVEIVDHSRRAGAGSRTRIIGDEEDGSGIDDSEVDEDDEVEVVSELRGRGDASGSGFGRNMRSQASARGGREEDRPAPVAAAAAAAMRRARQNVVMSDDDDEEDQPRVTRRLGQTSGGGNAEAGPSRGSRTSRRR